MNLNNLSIIAAVDLNGGIGYNNNLLWYIPEDLKYFKKITLYKTIVMGKNTWLSLPIKPLPNRENVIISKTINIDKEKFPDIIIFRDFYSALDYCLSKKNECFFIGGESIYFKAIDYVDRVYLTYINKKAELVNKFFPLEKIRDFYLCSEEKIWAQSISAEIYFRIYKRIK